MDHLDDVAVGDLQRALADVEEKTPAQRLLAAIAYKNGVSQTELAEWHGVGRRTVHNWLRRLEEEPLAEAARDDRRSGRPRKLDDDQRERLGRTLRAPPTAAGYDAPSWTPDLVRQHLRAALGVEYSRPSCRRLMREAGLRYGAPERSTADADPDDPGVTRTDGRRWTPR